MKLWQKVFFTTMVFVVLAVDITAITVLQKQFQASITREREQSIVQQEYFASDLSSQILYKRLKNNQIVLSQDDVEDIILEKLKNETSNLASKDIHIMMLLDDQVLTVDDTFDLDQQDDFLKQVKDSQNYITSVYDNNDQTYLLTGSCLYLENNNYLLLTSQNLTNLYQQYNSQLLLVHISSLVFAGILSIILLLIILKLLKPLEKLNTSILEIAKGNYHIRLQQEGAEEFKELSQNVNIMTQAIEEHSSRIQEIADERKRFVDHFAHEMKTPLTSIMGFADLLRIQKNMNDEQRQEYGSIILEETKRLKGLSTKLLELATTQEKMLDFEKISMKEFLTHIQTMMAPIMDKNHMQLHVVTEDIDIDADRQLFQSLILNLIDNAIKASKANDSIDMICSYQQDHVMISIQDHGIGMSQKELQKVLQPFYMVDASRSRQNGGAGLGLSLCSEIVKCHHAHMTIESELNKGTTVTIIMKGGNQ